MTEKRIPMVTWYKISRKGIEKFKKPMYVLESTESIKAKQDRLGENAAWYYGTNCKKCCGVFPAFFTEQTFEGLGYFVCLVCGRESQHEHMAWQAEESWNAGRYCFEPKEEYKQITLWDVIGERND